MDIEISLEQVVKGTDTTVIVPKFESCSHCGGSGAEHKHDIDTCPTCNGTGTVHRLDGTAPLCWQEDGQAKAQGRAHLAA